MERTIAAEIKKYSGTVAGLLLAAVVLAVYWPVGGYDFIALDDNLYLLDNLNVQRGMTLQNILWAMTTLETTNWHPLTWLSLMADYELFGLNPGGYHLTNLLIHMLNTLLLFTLLLRVAGDLGKSVVVAALFAVHPLNIESVVWIAERKNLLSTFFALLTLLTYVRYTQTTGWKWYGGAVVCFALGLMSKPMLVSLPFVLLLIDYWPLKRFSLWVFSDHKRLRCMGRLLTEKAPFFLLTLFSVLITYHAANTGGAVKSLSAFPLYGRMANAFVAYVSYLGKMIWPVHLAIFYPYPPDRPGLRIVAAILFVVLMTAFAVYRGGTFRYLIVGWFWYLITLIPVVGIVQVGFQSMANRYAYLPLIGIFVVLVWGVSDLLKGSSLSKGLPMAAGLMILGLAACTCLELPHWRNSEAAFLRALNVTKDNHLAQTGMGNVWFARGDLIKAKSHYLESLRIKPDYALAHNNLGLVLIQEDKVHEAATQYREALRDDPDFPDAYNNLGVLMAREGKVAAARAYFFRALELKPDYAAAQGNLSLLNRSNSQDSDTMDPQPQPEMKPK